MPKDFYSDVLSRVGIAHDASVLVICGGPYDRQTFFEQGFTAVTISNLDHHDRVESNYAPYTWVRQDAENLTFADDAYDWVVVNAGLHHCGSPHRALCEMLRVARKGVLVLEARDSFLMRIAVRLGLTVQHELEPTALSGASSKTSFGGYRNGFIPNYIYRWTERDVEKTVNSFLPQYQHTCQFFYGLRLPLQRLAMSKNQLIHISIHVVGALAWLFRTVMPKQGNLFAFAASKRGKVQPWLCETPDGFEINKTYMDDRFSPEKYRKP
jgi:SAM-dependent methyltransferase